MIVISLNLLKLSACFVTIPDANVLRGVINKIVNKIIFLYEFINNPLRNNSKGKSYRYKYKGANHKTHQYGLYINMYNPHTNYDKTNTAKPENNANKRTHSRQSIKAFPYQYFLLLHQPLFLLLSNQLTG